MADCAYCEAPIEGEPTRFTFGHPIRPLCVACDDAEHEAVTRELERRDRIVATGEATPMWFVEQDCLKALRKLDAEVEGEEG